MAARRAVRRKALPPVPEAATWRRRSPPAPPLASLGSVPALPLVQRQCGECGGEEEERRELPVQAKIKVGAADGRFEREADSVADRVMRMPGPAAESPAVSPLSGGEAGGDFGAALGRGGDGAPLAPEARGFLEPRFGRDLGHVRIHADAEAGALAESINALAFTHGSDIYFRSGRYEPASGEGRRLLAHEIAHTFQQGSGGETPEVQRAVVKYGAVSVDVEYGSVINVPTADLPGRVIAAIEAYTGSPPDMIEESTVRGLSPTAQNWLLFALKLVDDNRAKARTLLPFLAVTRLIDRAPVSSNAPLPDADNAFVREVMESSGWLENALASRLTSPGVADNAAIDKIVNPVPTKGKPGDPLDAAAFKRRLRPALEHLLEVLDPGRWKKVGAQSLSAFQVLGDVVQAEARSFFAPYADAAIGNVFSLSPPWHASANIFSTVTMVPTRGNRIGYLLNRSEMVGRATKTDALFTDTNIFAETRFDPEDATHQAVRAEVLDAIEKDPKFQAIVDRLIQHTGRQPGSGATAKIGLVTEFNADSLSACQAHWRGVDTLCHEVLHGLVHPSFEAAAGRTKFPQVMREGFTEMLGMQLFNQHVAKKAKSDKTFKAKIEAGVAGAPCPDPDPATNGYGAAGDGAQKILDKVKDDRFRAAYFLGETHLVGVI